MGVIEDFRSYINKYKIEKGKIYTNTSIGNPKISLYIPDDKYDEFINIYAKTLNTVPLYFTEKPTDPSPLRVDLDFRFPLIENGNKKKIERIYNRENVLKIVTSYFTIINKYLNITDENNIAYVMEKSNPVECKIKIKDGIHIVFPHIIISNNIQHFIRKKILDIANDIFYGLPICNEHESIIDKAIIDSNCWQMYGSRKPECEPYKVTEIYTYINNNVNKLNNEITATDEINFIKLFSMRRKETTITIKEEAKNEVEEYIKHILPSLDHKQKTKLNNNILIEKALNINKNYTNDDELELSRRLVNECLSHSRADKYDEWITLGWVLRNIDYRLLDSWIEFSKIGSSYVEGQCQNLWDKMRKDHMGIGTLRWWAKQDNHIKYEEIIDDSVIPLIDQCIRSDGAHYDVAKVVQAQYKDEFKAISKDCWYKFDKLKHKWVKTREGLNLRLILSNDICKKFMERANHWNIQLYNNNNNDEQRILNEEKSKKCIAIALKLKNSSFKDSVMKECKCLFIEEKFEELLDSRSHLIGFDNGVYDLKMHIFRDGMPDDYIFHSTQINYIPYNPTSIETIEIMEFFNKIFTNEAVRNYVLDILSCIIDGSIAQERFYIFTGQGSNGKSRLLDLVQKSVGDYYCILPIALLTQKRAASNSASSEIERTKGRRFAVMQEPSENDKINIGYMKELSGNDRILTRGLYKEPFEFKPQFKMILTCNELPEIPSDDGGTWRRIRVIEFLSKFCENPNINKKNEFNMDLELSEKFERWAETFISMLINRHNNINPNKINEPREVIAATESYKSNNDMIGQFINDKIIIVEDKKERLSLTKLYNDFRVWSVNNIPKNKKTPDRCQLKAYFEKHHGPYPTDNKGWKGMKYKVIEENDD
jgi:P4 family phage/plasmid primase-like protien